VEKEKGLSKSGETTKTELKVFPSFFAREGNSLSKKNHQNQNGESENELG
jgi:hypothetical protein